MEFTVQLGRVTVTCRRCGATLLDEGRLQAVDPKAVRLGPIEHSIDGPCPSCPSPGGDEELPDVTAAE